MGGGAGHSPDISDDEGDLTLAIQKIEEALRKEPVFLQHLDRGGPSTPRNPDHAQGGRGRAHRVTVQQIASVVRVATIGDVSAALGKLSIDNRLVPIRVQLDQASRRLDRIAALKLMTANGPVPLAAVAAVEVSEGPSVVRAPEPPARGNLGGRHRARLRSRSGHGPLRGNPADAEPSRFRRGHTLGRRRVQAELLGSFQNAMVLGVLLMMFVLILLFHSVLQPVTIIFSLLLSVGGVATALIVTQNRCRCPS